MHAGPIAAAIAGIALLYAAVSGNAASAMDVINDPKPWSQKINNLPRSVRIVCACVVVAGLSLAGLDDIANGLAMLIVGILVMNLARTQFALPATPAIKLSGDPTTGTPSTGATATA